LGLFRCAETYNGSAGFSMRLDGLSPTNNNARSRGIVMHSSDYVEDATSKICGRSWGCPSVDHKYYEAIIAKLKDGSPLLSHYDGRFAI